MLSTSYFAKQYFPSFYFGTKDSDTSCFLTTTIIGSSYISGELIDALGVTTSVAGMWIPLPWRDPNSTKRTTLPLRSLLVGSTRVNSSLTLPIPLTTTVRGIGITTATLTENSVAKKKYKQHKEEAMIAHMLLTM